MEPERYTAHTEAQEAEIERRIERRRAHHREDERIDEYNHGRQDDEVEDDPRSSHHVIFHPRNRATLDGMHPSHHHLNHRDFPPFENAGIVRSDSPVLNHTHLPNFRQPIMGGRLRVGQGVDFLAGIPNFHSPIFRGRALNFLDLPHFGGLVGGFGTKRRGGRKQKKSAIEFNPFDADWPWEGVR